MFFDNIYKIITFWWLLWTCILLPCRPNLPKCHHVKMLFGKLLKMYHLVFQYLKISICVCILIKAVLLDIFTFLNYTKVNAEIILVFFFSHSGTKNFENLFWLMVIFSPNFVYSPFFIQSYVYFNILRINIRGLTFVQPVNCLKF